jgi:hypothetical protein
MHTYPIYLELSNHITSAPSTMSEYAKRQEEQLKKRTFCSIFLQGRLFNEPRIKDLVTINIENNYCFLLTFTTPLSTTSYQCGYAEILGGTDLKISYLLGPEENKLKDGKLPSIIQTLLMNDDNPIHCEELRHPGIVDYDNYEALVDMIVWLGNGNTDCVDNMV